MFIEAKCIKILTQNKDPTNYALKGIVLFIFILWTYDLLKKLRIKYYVEVSAFCLYKIHVNLF